MCFSPKIPKVPQALIPLPRESAESMADRTLRKRKSTQDGYSNWALATGPSGVKDFGKAAQVPSLSAGTATNLGAG